ncbi:AMP-binding protein [Magnetospirillum fulvum]|uniref:Amino acid adenylation domain-containing protein n=1 Tax=Magnetospirillum fulvum TaxID=1082 RepID=A0A1H6J2C7_MAGFU|nr:AMP-binding protein [Magnetospirillum fulvum]SEH54753.1 amino acid adenylation domain-containing protein [Magnetospirillum fulvum]
MILFTVPDLLDHARHHWPERPFILSNDDTVTFGALAERVESFAGWLYRQGIRPGDRVGVHLQKSPEEIVAMLAAARIGAVWVNLSVHWSPHQVRDQARDCGMRLLVTGPRRAGELLREEWPETLERLVVFGDDTVVEGDDSRWIGWDEAIDTLPPQARAPIETDLAAICYTSGSTGRPKGVMLSHRNFVAATEIVAEYLGNSADDRLLSVLPCCFNYGLLQVLSMLLVGGSIVLQRVTMAAELAGALHRHQITGVAAVPSIWTPLVAYLAETGGSFPHLRYLTNAGGKCPDAVLARLPEVFPTTRIYLMYGMTETIRATYLPPDLFQTKRGAMGSPTRNTEIFIVDAEGRPCPPGVAGELVQRGPTVALGYWGRPEATLEKFRPCPGLGPVGNDRFCWSGDIVREDEDGILWFVGRQDFMIKSNGVRISPTEIEEAIHHFPGVVHAVAFGAPDLHAGQAIEVAVQAGEDGIDLGALRRFCRTALPGYLLPRRLHLWLGRMPTTGNGKIDTRAVIDTLLRAAEEERRTLPPTETGDLS